MSIDRGSTRRARGRALLALALALALAGLPSGGAAATGIPRDPSCGTPLGEEALAGANEFVEAGPDFEHAGVDAVRMPGGQRSPEIVLYAWGHLVVVGEAKVDQGTNFTWAIFARIHSNETGWNTTPIWLSSPDTSQYYPQGAHIRPSAVLFNDRIWVAWDAQGSTLGGPAERFILLRSFDRNLAADTTRIASSSDPNRTVQHPVLFAAGTGIELVYSTSEGDTAPGDTHIVARSFDGSGFQPAERASNLSDGWGDGLPAAVAGAGGELFVGWTSANATGQSSYLMFAWKNASGWSTPLQLAPLGNAGATGPAIAAFASRVYLAYSTANLVDLSGTDSEVRWFVFDPAAGSFSGPTTINPEPTGGDDAVPTLTVTPLGLAVGWSTTEDAVYSHSSDTDPVYRIFNGTAFGPVAELSAADDNASDGAPSFVSTGGALYAHWMLTPPQTAGDPRGNSREVVRLVSRPPAWYDNLSVLYTVVGVADNGSVRVDVIPGGPAFGHPLALRLPDGSLYPIMEPSWSAWVPVDPERPDLEVLACGIPIDAELRDAPGPLIGPNLSLLPLFMIAAVVIVFVAAWWWLSRRGSAPPPDGN